ncbi:MAG: hypothetical protein IJP16_03410 [Clostridia bacterium]|nr:hypothetical protein [Clostridia bacterium]
MDNITLKAKGFEITLDEKGIVSGLCYNGKSIDVEEKPFITLVKSRDGEVISPVSVSENGNGITASFDNAMIGVEVKSHNEWLELKLCGDLPEGYFGLDFGCVEIKGFVAGGEYPALFSYALTDNVHEHMYPDADNGRSWGTVMKKFGCDGARLAIAMTESDRICEVLKEIHSTLSPTDRAVSSIAGPYAREYHKNHGNYIIFSQTAPSRLDEYIDFFTRAGITQLDFHQGPNTFRQGDFYFHNYGGSAKRFKEEFAKPLSDAGILSGLHTYAYYIDVASPLLAEEKWQKQLCFLDDEYTLDEDFIPDQPFIKTVEDTSAFSTNHTFFSDSLPYVLIDSEIVLVKPSENGFAINGRGVAGTPHTTHKKGAKIKHFFGRFCMFTPVIGSELFYKIARDTAKAYNEGGFEMIYLDALDGIGHHCPKEEAWYWAGQFVDTIVKNCDTPPIIEYSTMYPSLWPCRARMGAWDTPYRGFKDFVKRHVAANNEWEKRHYTTTLGWYLAYPVMAQKYPVNYAMRYQFEEDIDFVGTEAFCHGSSMVFLSLTQKTFDIFPAFERNITNYRRYSEAMSDESLCALRPRLTANPFEKRLIEENGKKYFVEKHYKKSKIYASNGVDRLLFENPFKAQKPFIRLEAQLTGEEEGITLVHLDESCQISEGKHTFDYVDMTERLALRVRVKGNGRRSAVILRVGSTWNAGKGVADYTVFTDFEGWREIILAEVDNGNFPEFNAPVPSDFGAYSYYRSIVNYDHVDSVEIFTVGDVEGVCLGDIEAVAHKELEASSIRIGDVTVNASVRSGEYIELYPDGRAVKLDSFGHVESIEILGELPELCGEGSLEITADADGIPARFTATVGFTGEVI